MQWRETKILVREGERGERGRKGGDTDMDDGRRKETEKERGTEAAAHISERRLPHTHTSASTVHTYSQSSPV